MFRRCRVDPKVRYNIVNVEKIESRMGGRSMRIAVAEIAQETDSFSSLFAEVAEFEAYGLYFGDEIPEKMRGVGTLGGFLEVAEQHQDAVLLPIVRAWGGAGGTIRASAFEMLLNRLVEGLRRSLPLDAVFLAMHGAAASEHVDDVEGQVLASVREIVGDAIPVVVALDHHANITSQMASAATTLIGYETQPHDPPATGRKAGRILFRILRGEIRPQLRWRKIPMITPQDNFLTSEGPMQAWFDLARRLENRAGVLDVSPYPMQPWLDVAEGGWAVVVHTDGDAALAQAVADEMAQFAWDRREAFWASQRTALGDALQKADAAASGLVILADTGDSVYGGAPGDNTTLLRAMLERPIHSTALVPLVDAAAVEAAHTAGVGSTLSLDLGGKMDHVFSRPLRARGRVQATSSRFVVDLRDRGVCDLGRTALLEIGPVRLALLDHRSFAINHPILYTHLGLAIEEAKMVVVKTASNFQFFAPWRKDMMRVDTPGTTQSDLTAFRWQRLPRPVYPLDPITWHA